MQTRTNPIISVLAILPSPQDRTSLQEIFSHSKWNLRMAEALYPARTLIDELGAGVVISDTRLPDGCWQDVLLETQCRPVAPVLIVVSRLADESLWAEVRNLGGYDVLATPLEPREVIRSVSLAWRHWQDRLAVKVLKAGSSAWPDS